MKYGFNTATGVLAASLGVLGFSAILLPPGADSGGSNNGEIFGQKVEKMKHGMVQHELPMTRQDFVDEAAKSSTGTAGAAGIWNGVPVIVVYVDHDKNKDTPVTNGKARFQTMEGYDETGKRIGHLKICQT